MANIAETNIIRIIQEQKVDYITRKTCRVCDSSKLVKIFSLGNLYVNNFVKKEDIGKGIKAPLELVLCENCSLLQLRHTAPQELLYSGFYWYRSGVTQTMKNALKEIVETVSGIAKLKANDAVLDIGANDGTLLSYYAKGIVRIGCEPANNLVDSLKENCEHVIHDFWTEENYAKLKVPKAKVVTAIGMFYDMEDPNQFVRDAAKVLAEDGIFVAQLMCLKNMLEKNDVGNICVKPDTLILGDNKPISQLVENNYAIGSGGSLVKIKNTMNRQYNGEIIKINPMYLEPITTTPEHPIRIVKKECFRHDCMQYKTKIGDFKLGWVPAKDVKRGDFVVVPKLTHNQITKKINLNEFNQINSKGYRGGLLSLPINKDTAWLLGLYVAEGCIGGKVKNPYINFTINKKETHLLEKITSTFKALGYKTGVIHYNDRNSIEVRVVCAALARALPSLVGKGAINKHIPDFIMFSPVEIKIEFLRGLFEGDGYIKGNKVHFHTSSKTLTLQVQLLTASLGGILGISYVKPYIREIRGGKVISKDSWQLRGTSKSLGKIFGYEHKGAEISHVIYRDNHILVPVKSIEGEKYNDMVCNIETEDETYLVSNAIVHNCHEHLEYYSLESLKYLFEKNGLEIFKIEENEINGGSYRLYSRHLRNGSVSFDEKFTAKDYQDFFKRVEENRKKCVDFIKQEADKGKKIYVYGASTKGNTILQYYGLTAELVKGAAERSPEKFGRFTIGTWIPIMPEDEARKTADYFLILPYAFLNEFIKREEEWRSKGGRFIVPIPEFKVV